MTILSIQSHVVSGHVGNAAAVFLLQRLGFEVWPIHTVQFSNHPGYGDFTGRAFEADHVVELVEGLARRGLLTQCRAVLSGYLGEPALGHAVAAAVERVRRESPRCLYLCDPVMGDRGGLYVKAGIPELLTESLVPAADVITPNAFELELLAGSAVSDEAGALAAARRLVGSGGEGRPSVVAVTSVERPGEPGGELAVLAVTAREAWRVATPRLAVSDLVHGGGDAFAALLLGHYVATGSLPMSLELAASALLVLFRRCREMQAAELPLIAAQQELGALPRLLHAEQVA